MFKLIASPWVRRCLQRSWCARHSKHDRCPWGFLAPHSRGANTNEICNVISTSREPKLNPNPVPQSREAGEPALSGELHALRWVYGSVLSSALEDFAARQRELRNGRPRTEAMYELYEDVAHHWRQLQTFLDKRSRLEELRKNTKVSRGCTAMQMGLGTVVTNQQPMT